MRGVYISALVLVAAAMAGLAHAQGFTPGNAVRINGVEISNQRFNAIYTEHRRDKGVAVGARGDQLNLMKELRIEAMDLLIEKQLLVQAAAAKGIVVTDEEVDAELAAIKEPFKDDDEFRRRLESESFTEADYRQHLGDLIAAKRYIDDVRMQAGSVSDEEVEKYYHENEHRLTLPEQVRVRHVLRSWRPTGKGDDRQALFDEMQEILGKARGGEDFAQLASAYSNDSTRVNGGDVGLFRRGQMMPSFERAAFALQPGEISDIVETTYGLHIIKMEERQPSRLLPLEEIREQLREHISEEKMEKAVKKEHERLRAEADVEILIPLKKPEDMGFRRRR